MTQQTPIKSISDILDITKGKKVKVLSSRTKNSIPYLLIDTLRGKEPEFFTEDKRYTEANENDILMVFDGANSGLVGSGLNGAVGSTIGRLRPKKDIYSKYITYFLSYNFSSLNQDVKGSAIPHVKPKKLLDLKIRYPLISEQSLIVQEIETQFTRLDAAVKSLKAVKQKLEIYRKAVLKKTFEKKEGWEEKKLKYLVEEINSGYACGRHAKSGEGLVHFRPYNITPSGNISYELVKIVDPNFSDKRLKYGDIIFNNTNSQVWVGKTCAYDKNEEVGFSNHMTRIRINKDLLNFKYLAKYLHFLFQKGFYYKIMKSHVNQSSVNIDRLQEIDIPHPKSLQEQQSIVSSIESKFSIIDKVEQVVEESLKKTEKLRKSILKAAFEGKLVKVVNENG